MNLSEDVGDLSSLFRVRFNSWPTSLEEIESHLPRDEAQRLASRQKLESVSFLFEPKERDLSLSVRIDGKPAWTSTIEPVPQRTPRVRTDATKAFP